jgi:glycosyltransferase involved in cell wall biosynthesis
VVDGLSVDDTVRVARRLWPHAVVVNQTRRGKGNALACGFAAVTGDIVVMLDADGSADPAEIPAFVAALNAGADFAKGSRFRPGGGSADITPLRRLGNRVLNGIVNVLLGTRYTDLCYGYNAIWADRLPLLGLESGRRGTPAWGDGFEVETLINMRVTTNGLNIVEVPSFEDRRIHGVSNLNVVTDGWRVLRTIAKEWYRLRAARTRKADAAGPSGSAPPRRGQDANRTDPPATPGASDFTGRVPAPPNPFVHAGGGSRRRRLPHRTSLGRS